MVFTSVAGHLLELEFESRVKGWHSCPPRDLYDAQVFKGVPKVGWRVLGGCLVGAWWLLDERVGGRVRGRVCGGGRGCWVLVVWVLAQRA